MTDFIIKKLPYKLTSNAGLALVGQYFKRLDIGKSLDREFPIGKGGIANSDVLKGYLGLLVQGKNDFEAIEAFRGDDFFAQSLGIQSVASSPTLRQRLDAHAVDWFELPQAMNERLLSGRYAGKHIDFGALPCGYMPIDWDTFVMNNDGSKKEAVGRTYQGVDGYTPSATYLGTQGYCLELALRPGVQHSAMETELNLERVLPMATRLTPQPLLFRADSGLCSLKSCSPLMPTQGLCPQRLPSSSNGIRAPAPLKPLPQHVCKIPTHSGAIGARANANAYGSTPSNSMAWAARQTRHAAFAG